MEAVLKVKELSQTLDWLLSNGGNSSSLNSGLETYLCPGDEFLKFLKERCCDVVMIRSSINFHVENQSNVSEPEVTTA